MKKNLLEISYECFNAIGNSFDLYAMMSEVVETFHKTTKSDYTVYASGQIDEIPIVMGRKIQLPEYIERQEHSLLKMQNRFFVHLVLKKGSLNLVYSQREDIEEVYSLLCSFVRKINFAISACEGVKELEEMNDSLETTIRLAIRLLA